MKRFLSILWLLLATVYEAEGRVAKDFSSCSQFFFNNQKPAGFESIAQPHDFKKIPDGIKRIADLSSPAYICQMSGGNSYFATLYDRGRRVPLYSAYILDRISGVVQPDCKRINQFKLEPQLAYRELSADMKPVADARTEIKNYNKKNGISEREENKQNQPNNLLAASQAMDSDYDNSGYTRGHLNPCGHHGAKDNYVSTYTLTNMVPTLEELNNAAWGPYEIEMINIGKEAKCSQMYVVTGIVPGNNKIGKLNNKQEPRVTIPSYVWNAYCCVNKNGAPIKSGAGIAPNDKSLINSNDKSSKKDEFSVDKMEIGELQDKLKKLLNVEIVIFSNNCRA
ncbi:endonuclease domain-containing 1 protein-like [Hyperolius riggenbachi]|uniref:endonuclease domain-containing 1 protein-like n=1 Tax=Hyperolius riggenbachi TaxID=752182 RepID=UPI0035A33BE5